MSRLDDAYRAQREQDEARRAREAEGARRLEEMTRALTAVERDLFPDIRRFLDAMKRARNPGTRAAGLLRPTYYWVLWSASLESCGVVLTTDGELRWAEGVRDADLKLTHTPRTPRVIDPRQTAERLGSLLARYDVPL